MKRAAKEGFAVPAINTQGGNYDIIWACCKAAQEMRSPMILAHYVATGAFSGNDCTTTSAGVIPHDGVTGYIGFLGGDSIVRNPALPFLTEIFLRLDETAKISRMDILTNIPQGPNTVQPWVLRVNNVGNLVFLIHLASPRSFSFFDFV